MKTSSVNSLENISFLQATIAEKSEIKNFLSRITWLSYF